MAVRRAETEMEQITDSRRKDVRSKGDDGDRLYMIRYAHVSTWCADLSVTVPRGVAAAHSRLIMRAHVRFASDLILM